MRAPIWLFRARLGILFGSRLVLLEHIGRTTGRRRYVVLEVVARPSPHTYVVASGFGTEAQWFRNIQADPRVRLTVRSNRAHSATATILEARQASAALRDYAAAHPRAWRSLKPVFEQTLGTSITEQGTALPLVAITLETSARSQLDAS